MNNIFAEDIKKEQEIKANYNAAATEEERETARKAYQMWKATVIEKGEEYGRIYRFLSEAAERGNEYIAISECHDYRDEKTLIELFRKYGIEKFIFASGWSSAVDSAWIFTQNGCTIEGMTEYNTQGRAWGSDEFEKKHGYLFKVN